MKTRARGVSSCNYLLAALMLATAACNTDAVRVSPEVAAIVSRKCAECHSKKLANTPENDRVPWEGGCAACHAPLPVGHEEQGCTGCHTSPAESHFSLRDAEYQDPTLSMTLDESWIYDPDGDTWRNPPVIPVWGAQVPSSPAVRKQAEDSFGMIWNMSIPDYRARYGCAVKCHGNTPGAAVFTDADSAVAAAWSAYASLGAVVPERVLEVPSGSRADVASAAGWQDGVWIFEFKRRLQTGRDDDVQFDPSREVEFSAAVFDNCGWGEVPAGHTTYGDGQYQVLRFIAADSKVTSAPQ